MGLKISFAMLAITAAIGGAQAFAAGPVNIPNGSFEAPNALNANDFHSLPLDFTQTDWVHAPQPGDWPYPNDGPFVWIATAGVFHNNAFINTPNYVSGVDGLQGGFFFNTYHNEITQELATTWNPGSVYHLSFSAQGGGQGLPVGAQLKVWLYYLDGPNKVPVAEFYATNTFNNPTGSLPITQLVGYGAGFDTDVIPASLAGKNIGIAVSSTATGYDFGLTGSDFGYWDIDNIQLTELPEPASLGILAIGAAGLMMRRRRA